MQIPSSLKPVVDAYHQAGQLTGSLDRIELDKKSATDCLNHLKDEFKHWKSLDESDLDLRKGEPGVVRIETSGTPGEYSEASFAGNTQKGELKVAQAQPSTHYGLSTYAETHFSPKTVENYSVQHTPWLGVGGPQLLHIDRELSTDGPVMLGGSGPVSVILTDKAADGYVISTMAFATQASPEKQGNPT